MVRFWFHVFRLRFRNEDLPQNAAMFLINSAINLPNRNGTNSELRLNNGALVRQRTSVRMSAYFALGGALGTAGPSFAAL